MPGKCAYFWNLGHFWKDMLPEKHMTALLKTFDENETGTIKMKLGLGFGLWKTNILKHMTSNSKFLKKTGTGSS